MARRRRERMSEGKKNIIAGLIQEYDIKTAEDIQEALKDLLGGTIQEMMEAELDEHLGYDEYDKTEANTLIFPNAKVTIGESQIDTKVNWMRASGTYASIYKNSILSQEDAVFTPDTSGRTSEVAWYFKTPKTVDEATAILKNLKYYYEKKEGLKGAIKVEVDANETTMNTKPLAIKEYDGKFYALVNTSADKTWNGSYANAKNYIYRGRKGYLAALTNEAEEKFTHDAFGVSEYWTGGTRLVDKDYNGTINQDRLVDRNAIDQTDWKKLNITDRNTLLNSYYWSAGPKAGVTIDQGRWNGNEPSGGNDAAAFMYYQNTDRKGLWDYTETKNLNSLIEFGGYNVGNDPGGYEEPNYSTDMRNLDAKLDQNGIQTYKYTAKVFDARNQTAVEGAVLKIKVPSPDGDPNKEYVYMDEQGGVKTDENGEAILWLPEGTYTPTGNDVYKEGLGGLIADIDATFSVKSDAPSKTVEFWIGDSNLEIELGTHDIVGSTTLWAIFPHAEYLTDSTENEVSMLSVSVSKGGMDVSEVVANGDDWDMTDRYNYTYVWVFGSQKASKAKVESILRKIKFKYVPGMKITVQVDTNETSDSLKKSAAKQNGKPNGYSIMAWNKNFYTFIEKKVSWEEAYNEAKSFVLGGRRGYLGTLTSSKEGQIIQFIAEKNSQMWIGGTSYLNNDKSKVLDPKTIKISNLTVPTGYPFDKNTNKQYYYWSCGPEAGKSLGWMPILGNEPGGINSKKQVEAVLGIDLYSSGSVFFFDYNYADLSLRSSNSKQGMLVEFGGYDEGKDPGRGLTIKRVQAVRTITENDAYYTYPVVTAGDVQKDTYAEKKEALENGGGYKAQLTTAFKNAVNQKTTYTATSQNKWEAGTALPNPNLNKASYTYDMGEYPIISVSEMFKDMPALETLDLTAYILGDTVPYMNNMFAGAGKVNGEFPAIGLSYNEEMATKFNAPETGIDKTKLYFGNVSKVNYTGDNITPITELYYGNEATSLPLNVTVPAGKAVDTWTVANAKDASLTKTYDATPCDVTDILYTNDTVTEPTDKSNRELRAEFNVTVTLKNSTDPVPTPTPTPTPEPGPGTNAVEAYFNGDMATANPSAAVMRGAWANESEGYVDFYVRDVGNADGRISVENLKKLSVSAELAYGFENVEAFKADGYKNVVDSDITALYVVNADQTETEISTLADADNTKEIVIATATPTEEPANEEETEIVGENEAENIKEDIVAETISPTEEAIAEDAVEETVDEEIATMSEEEQKEAIEPTKESDIALMATTYVDGAEIVTFTDTDGNEQKYTKVRVKISNVLASGIVTFKLSYNTGADTLETVTNAEYDVIVPGDVDKNGQMGVNDVVLVDGSLGGATIEKGRTGNYLFEMSDLDNNGELGVNDVVIADELVNNQKIINKDQGNNP